MMEKLPLLLKYISTISGAILVINNRADGIQIDKFNKKYGLVEYAPKEPDQVSTAPRKHWSDEKRKEYLIDYDTHAMAKEELAAKYNIKVSDVYNRASKIRKLLTKKGVI